jgi:hypothetical protein
MFIRRFRVQGLRLTISVECPNPKTRKHGKINIILNPKPTEKEFGFMNLFTRKSEGGTKNSGMNLVCVTYELWPQHCSRVVTILDYY